MKNIMLSVSFATFTLVATLQAAEQKKDVKPFADSAARKAHAIINKKCTSCHSKAKIDQALSSGKDMNKIQKEMEKRGAKLSANESEVLGIFWKQSKPISK